MKRDRASLILSALAEGPMHAIDLEDATGIARYVLSGYLARLALEHRIERVGSRPNPAGNSRRLVVFALPAVAAVAPVRPPPRNTITPAPYARGFRWFGTKWA